ncbi:MAG: DUF2971 domain-containing protein [Candidatus Neomarinimicrobiota bacterium]
MALPPKKGSQPFPQPDDPTIRVWRYYDAARFSWLLENSQLYLPSIAELDDYFAGSVPKPEIVERAAFLQDLGQPDLVDYYTGKIEQLRRSVYVSCWRLGNDDSNAMWQLYCGDEEGVAIRTTYANLVDTFASKWRSVGLVTYLNYAKDDIPEGNVRHPFMYKRSEFAYENEVRIAEGLDPFLDPAPKRSRSTFPSSGRSASIRWT